MDGSELRYQCLTTTESTPWKFTGLSADTTCEGIKCQGLMKILSAKAMLGLAKRYPNIQFPMHSFIDFSCKPLDLGEKKLLNETFIALWPHRSPPTKSHACTPDLDSCWFVKRMIRSSDVSKRNFKESCRVLCERLARWDIQEGAASL